MRTVLAALGVLCFMGSCSSGMTSSKGIVCDATMNTVAIVTDKNDTLSFSTMNANKEEVDGLLLNDTLEVFYTGKYTPGMQASKLVQYPQSLKLGGDRDEHGCIGSAGYVWCEVQQDCIRLFEKGIRTEAVDGSTASAFIVFSPDSTRLELFFSDEQPNENASKSGEDVSNPEASTATEQSDIPVPAENPSSETASQTQTAEPDNADLTSTSDATDEDEIEDATHADTETVPSEAETSAGSNFSPTYREPILTDGILVDDIFKAIDQLAETGECDLGTIIYHCESMRYAG